MTSKKDTKVKALKPAVTESVIPVIEITLQDTEAIINYILSKPTSIGEHFTDILKFLRTKRAACLQKMEEEAKKEKVENASKA